jgi:uncharacterized protein (TIGR03435 family)
MGMGTFARDSITMSDLAGGFLTNNMDRPVLDKTGVTGEYRIHLDWSDELRQASPTPGQRGLDPGIVASALRRVGLSLVSTKALVNTLVIDHVNKEPTPN